MEEIFKFLENPKYLSISPTARLLYVYMLSRTKEAINKDEIINEGWGWITFKREDMSAVLGVTKNTIRKELRQLVQNDLITDIRIGRNVPNLIYVNGIADDKIKKYIKIYREINIKEVK